MNDMATKHHVPRRSVPPLPEMLPPCRVCGDKASGLHYGANTCEACKAFFRRSLSESYRYCCTGDGICDVGRALRRKTWCNYCRYQRCLDSGMAKRAIKTGRYSFKRRAMYRKEMGQGGVLTTSDNKGCGSRNSSTEMIDETTVIKIHRKGRDRETITRRRRPCDNNPSNPPSHEAINSGNNHKALNINNSSTLHNHTNDISTHEKIAINVHNSAVACTVYDVDIQSVTDAYMRLNPYAINGHTVEEFRQRLTNHTNESAINERVFGKTYNITKKEYDDFYSLTGMVLYDRDKRCANNGERIEFVSRLLIAFAKAIPGFKELEIEDQASLVKGSAMETPLFHQYLYMDWPSKTGMLDNGRFYGTGQAFDWMHQAYEYLFQCGQKIRDLDLTDDELAILNAICVVCPDRRPLKEPKKVEMIFYRFIENFRSLLRRRAAKRADGLFYKAWDILIFLRNVTEEFQKIMCNVYVEWPESFQSDLARELWLNFEHSQLGQNV